MSSVHLLLLFLLSLAFTACSAPAPPALYKSPATVQAEQLEAESQGYTGDFRERYGFWNVSPGEVPDNSRRSFTELTSRMVLLAEAGLTLQFRAGAMTKTDGYYRTKSRYRLTAGEKSLAMAESMAGLPLADSMGSVAVMRDRISGAILISEFNHNFNRRYILMQRASEGGNWSVRYFHLPEPKRTMPVGPFSECLGFGEGKVYFRSDDRTYAIPLELLEEEKDLRFGIG